MSASRQPRSQPRTGKTRDGKAIGRFDQGAGVWLVPVSDAWLDLVSRDWSRPVQLRAVTADGGTSYSFKVRDPLQGDVIDRLVHVLAIDAYKWRELRGPAAENEIRHSVERGLMHYRGATG